MLPIILGENSDVVSHMRSILAVIQPLSLVVLQFQKATEISVSVQKLWIILKCFYLKVPVTRHFVS